MRIVRGQVVAAGLLLILPLSAARNRAWAEQETRLPVVLAAVSPAVQQMIDFQASEVKFPLAALTATLRDHRHEGWVLSAYADPTTHKPLIGAGFSLDLPERDHPQQDLRNLHPFFEPSSAQLWQAAGLDPARLQEILEQFYARPVVVKVRRRPRRKPKPPPAQISDEQAGQLLRIAAIQAIFNAKAYCREFDSLTAPQQMALTQLVYQMGVNLEEFSDFLSLLNDDHTAGALALGPAEFDDERWRAAQEALVQSQWARLYRMRAISVIAMLDPRYLDDPSAAELKIAAYLPAPVVAPRSRVRPAMRLRDASYRKRVSKPGRKQVVRGRKKT